MSGFILKHVWIEVFFDRSREHIMSTPPQLNRIPNESDELAHSLWSATANPSPTYPPLEGVTRTTVAVVGGGFTGLSAALHLAEQGIDTVLLEAQHPGWGASGRNGGQVIPGLKEDPDTLIAKLGSERGEALVRLAGGAPDRVFELIQRHGIHCDATREGWIQPAHDARSLALCRARAEQWQRRGAPIEILDRAETARLLGSEHYLGALLDRRGGGVHPLNYALGLAEAAQRAGARLHGQSPVQALQRNSSGFSLTTPQGTLQAEQMLLCTNAYSDALHPALRRSVIPVCSVQVASAPLSDNLRRSILPEGQVASDMRTLLLYYRLDAAGRLLMGGRGAYAGPGIAKQQVQLRQAAERLFPQLGELQWQHHWGGFVALTLDHLPHLQQVDKGLYCALGYNGRGVAMATTLGKVLAEWLSGTPEEALGFPVSRLQTIPLHGLRKPIVSLVSAWHQFRERVS